MLTDPLSGKRIWVLVGTRPEVIKQIPLFEALVKKHGRSVVALVGTGQHRELLDQALAHFKTELDVNLGIMKAGQSLSESSAAVLAGVDALLQKHKPRWLIVQGDTTSAAMAALAAFHNKVGVIHNEAGLRSYDLQHPFPEEANRKLIAVIADLHFAPTLLARKALLAEGVLEHKVHVTGNSGIDALQMTLAQPEPKRIRDLREKLEQLGLQPILLTAHRRENQGAGMDQWFDALSAFMRAHPDLALIYPAHPNNAARAAAEKHLSGMKQIMTVSPFDYGETCHLLNHCRFVVTDSGGIQEEASTLGLPVVVCRQTTERMEAVHAGLAQLAGTEVDRILKTMEWAYSRQRAVKPGQYLEIFGNGKAAENMVELFN